MQVGLHASPARLFQSSHSSVPVRKPSPQIAVLGRGPLGTSNVHAGTMVPEPPAPAFPPLLAPPLPPPLADTARPGIL